MLAARRQEPSRRIRSAGDQDAESGLEHRVARFLGSFQVLLHSARLYQKNHPRILESLQEVERNLRTVLEQLSFVSIGIERGSLVLSTVPDRPLPDQRGELKALAEELGRCGIASLVLLPETHLGELDTFAHLMNSQDTLTRNRAAVVPNWTALIRQHRIVGIQVNTPIKRRDDTVLASLMAALLAYGGTASPTGENSSPNLTSSDPSVSGQGAATLDEMTAGLRLLGRLTRPLKHAQQTAPQEAARVFHSALGEEDRRAVALLVAAIVRVTPAQGEKAESYVARLANVLVLEAAGREFVRGRRAPRELRGIFARLGSELAAGAGLSHTGTTARDSALAGHWADESYAEDMHERFWIELPANEKSNALRSGDAWCVPVRALRLYLEQLADAGRSEAAREARLALLSYAGCLESESAQTRRAVAAGLAELPPVLERLWSNEWAQELCLIVIRALGRETLPGIAALVAAVTEGLARLTLDRGDYAEFERILEALESAPRDIEHAHLTALASRFVADERWFLLVDAALANHSLDPALPRLLRRDVDRLLERLGLLLTAPQGLDSLPAMARLLRAVGEPALAALEKRLTEARRQRAAAAVKLLAATQPERLAAALPRALPRWDWGLQDLAVSELAQKGTPGVPRAFLAALPGAHSMVAPILLDQIGLAQETAAVPLLREIAAGEDPRFQDVFIRIKAVESLGRMRAAEAADVLRAILHRRNGLTHAEPAGLRAAAEEALALIENRPSSERVRAIQETTERASRSFARARRYPRIPLPSPLAARIEGPHAEPARVRTISLGGAFLESAQHLAVGSPIRVEIRSGMSRIHSTAVVRNVAPNGGGVEFVHMKEEDREKLRRLVRRLHHK